MMSLNLKIRGLLEINIDIDHNTLLVLVEILVLIIINHL